MGGPAVAFDEPPAPEFPNPAVEWLDAPAAVTFLRFMGASRPLGASAAVRFSPRNRSSPMCRLPRRLWRRQAVVFASAVPMPDGFRCGVW